MVSDKGGALTLCPAHLSLCSCSTFFHVKRSMVWVLSWGEILSGLLICCGHTPYLLIECAHCLPLPLFRFSYTETVCLDSHLNDFFFFFLQCLKTSFVRTCLFHLLVKLLHPHVLSLYDTPCTGSGTCKRLAFLHGSYLDTMSDRNKVLCWFSATYLQERKIGRCLKCYAKKSEPWHL